MRKNFLILMLLALLPMVGFAADLDASKFTAANIKYGATELPLVSNTQGLTQGTHYTVETNKFYTGEGTGETSIGTAGATLAATPAGIKYYMKVTGIGDYDGQVIYVGFWINGVAVTIDFTADQTKEFGVEDPDITYTLKKEGVAWDAATGKAALGLTVERAEGEHVNATGYAYSFDWTNKNYSLTRDNTDEDVFTITAKAVTPTIELGTEALTYTGANQAPTITVKVGGVAITTDDYDLTYQPDGGVFGADHANATNYTVKATLKRDYSGNVTSIGKFTIAKAPLTVYVNNFSKEYTAADADLSTATFAYSGLVGADAEDATPFDGTQPAFTAAFVSGEAGTHKNVASYNVKPVLNADATKYDAAKYGNYSATLLSTGKVTVTAKSIKIKPTEGQYKTFGDDDPAFTVDASEAFTDDQATVKGAYKVTRTNASVNAVGNYEDVLTLSKKTGLNAATEKILANYVIDATATGDFEIKGATLYVYPKNVNITYGDDDAELEVIATTASGTEVELTTTPTVVFKGLTETPKAAGTYVLTLDGDAAATGYTKIEKLDGQYIINQKALTVTPLAQVLHVGDKVTNLKQEKVEYTGLVGDDVIGYKLSFNKGTGDGQIAAAKFTDNDDTKALLAAAEGNYAKGIKVAEDLTVEGNKNANYIITWTATGALTVGGATTVNFLADNDDWAEIEKFNDKTATGVTLKNRANQPLASYAGDWKAEEWNTIILPFKTSARKISAAFGYAIVNVVNPSATTTGNVKFKLQMSGDIPANTPIAVKTDADIAAGAIINFGNIDGEKIVKPADKKVSINAGAGHKFVGVYETVKIDKNTPNYHFLVNGGWKHIGASSTRSFNIVPFNCYLDQSNTASASELIISFEEIDGSVTAIKAVEASVVDNNSSVKNTGWYSINGMKLDAAPTKKGIYIKNGKKYVVK